MTSLQGIPAPISAPELALQHREVIRRATVVAASVLLGVSTIVPSFTVSNSDSLGVHQGGFAGTFWHANPWLALPVLLVLIAMAGIAKAMTSPLDRVNHGGVIVGLAAFVPLGLECVKAGLAESQSRGSDHLKPSAGIVLGFLAAVVLVVWPRLWSRAHLRAERRRIGGMVNADGSWSDPKLVWSEYGHDRKHTRATEEAPAPRAAGWYPDKVMVGWLQWYDGVSWTNYRAKPDAEAELSADVDPENPT